MARATSGKRELEGTPKTLKKIKHCGDSQTLGEATKQVTNVVSKLQLDDEIQTIFTSRKNVYAMRTIKKFIDPDLIHRLNRQVICNLITAALLI